MASMVPLCHPSEGHYTPPAASNMRLNSRNPIAASIRRRRARPLMALLRPAVMRSGSLLTSGLCCKTRGRTIRRNNRIRNADAANRSCVAALCDESMLRDRACKILLQHNRALSGPGTLKLRRPAPCHCPQGQLGASAVSSTAASNQVDQPALGIGIAFDIALRG
jgi:hypothetical protein